MQIHIGSSRSGLSFPSQDGAFLLWFLFSSHTTYTQQTTVSKDATDVGFDVRSKSSSLGVDTKCYFLGSSDFIELCTRDCFREYVQIVNS